jgi:hypothetical protein
VSDVLEEIREIKTEIRIKQSQGKALQDMIRNHPAKPQPGEGGGRGEQWAAIKEPLEQQRLDLARQVRGLQSEVTELRESLNQKPLDGRTVSHVLDKLVDIEALFTVEGHVAAWDSITSLTDWLEDLEASQ